MKIINGQWRKETHYPQQAGHPLCLLRVPHLRCHRQSAEKALRTAYNGTKATFNTPWGKRVIDSYSKNVIREAKYGYQGLSEFIQQEINKDVWILNNTSVKRIEWHFYWSSVSNSGGPSGPLLKELARCGIKVIFH